MRKVYLGNQSTWWSTIQHWKIWTRSDDQWSVRSGVVVARSGLSLPRSGEGWGSVCGHKWSVGGHRRARAWSQCCSWCGEHRERFLVARRWWSLSWWWWWSLSRWSPCWWRWRLIVFWWSYTSVGTSIKTITVILSLMVNYYWFFSLPAQANVRTVQVSLARTPACVNRWLLTWGHWGWTLTTSSIRSKGRSNIFIVARGGGTVHIEPPITHKLVLQRKQGHDEWQCSHLPGQILFR